MTWEYISGFFDADGYITLSRVKKNAHRTPVIGFTNVEITILETIRDFIKAELNINGFISTKRKKGTNDSYDLQYNYLPKTVAMGKKMKSIHRKKKHRLNMVVEQLPSIVPRNGKYTKEQLLKREEFEERFYSIK